MSKHKPALPERLYYRLADAAQFLGCSADDLLHYGVCGYIELLAATDFYWATGTDYDYQTESHFVSTSPFNNFNFFSLYAATLKLLEYKGAAYTGTAKALYKAWKGSVYRAELDGNRSVRLTEDIARHESQSDFSWQLSKTPREEIAGIISGEKQWIKITHSDLWVRTAELHRFQKEGSSHVRSDPPMPEEAVFSGKSDKLMYLNQAASKFWGNADPNDRATHPDNDAVAAWLEGKGYSASLALKGASIVRPEWASVGRKPEE